MCIMEEFYQGWWDVNFLTDYGLCLKWDVVAAEPRRKSQKNTFHTCFFTYFSVYCCTIWAFSKYISSKFSIICLIQHKNILSYNIVLYILSKRLYLKNLIWVEKMCMIFGFSIKNCLKISYYIFDLENITGQCYRYFSLLTYIKWSYPLINPSRRKKKSCFVFYKLELKVFFYHLQLG